MREPVLNLLLDQNVPVAAADWLRGHQPDWAVIIIDNQKIRVRRLTS